MNVLKENIGNLITLASVILLMYLCIRSLVKSRKAGIPSCSCGKNCSTCALRYMHGMAERKA